jgi:hypothetical protein
VTIARTVVAPVPAAVVCNEAKKAIKAGVAIETENLSVCGNKGYRPGSIGHVGMQQQPHRGRRLLILGAWP